MKILITGSNGMLGHDLIEVFHEDNVLINTTSKTLDITNRDDVINFIGKEKPDVVINSAAYTNVDDCETNQEMAYAVNGDGVKNLALACKETDSVLVHISTDYVFKGDKDTPRLENDELGPMSIYGKSKLKGEEAILSILDKYFIIRTAWLYGCNGGNFPKTMLELAKEHDTLTVVYDEVGSPTYTLDLAKAISELIKTDNYGIYHVTNSDSCSWFEFAKLIFELADVDVEVTPVTAKEFARPAPRPSYSVLDNRKWVENGFEPLRSYKDAIKDYIDILNGGI
ncbi:MAG: dTDP-4-dehydrorhamnose reductase [Methanobrevibacter sp.]|uniref:dTDP-4-dehydrorhamnose reductase n=1 Tax=Methanobrevibacter sp. TaxID=66852 RepID=UPI0026E08AA6|nr:dTDP-4-dehydrorhamnose reductase [Methanobrevibacter sp.]MDO5848659.1 dTDP-4-dehydrorhamnose reductase [Methanobrevibacter sp.]